MAVTLHVFAPLGHLSDPAFLGPPSVLNGDVVEQEQGYIHSILLRRCILNEPC